MNKSTAAHNLHALSSWIPPGVQYIAFYPGTLNGPLSIALPSPVSYIPAFSSQLSDHMNLWGRVKNLFYSFLAPVGRNGVKQQITYFPGYYLACIITHTVI